MTNSKSCGQTTAVADGCSSVFGCSYDYPYEEGSRKRECSAAIDVDVSSYNRVARKHKGQVRDGVFVSMHLFCEKYFGGRGIALWERSYDVFPQRTDRVTNELLMTVRLRRPTAVPQCGHIYMYIHTRPFVRAPVEVHIRLVVGTYGRQCVRPGSPARGNIRPSGEKLHPSLSPSLLTRNHHHVSLLRVN